MQAQYVFGSSPLQLDRKKDNEGQDQNDKDYGDSEGSESPWLAPDVDDQRSESE